MAPKTKQNNTSKPHPAYRATRSHTRADITGNVSSDTHRAPEDPVPKPQSKDKGREAGGKRKIGDVEVDENAPRATKDASGSKTAKRKKYPEPETRTYINPFVPEPSLTVAEHEAHSRALSQAQHIAVPTEPSASKVIASAAKARSQTPARPLLVLAPLLPPNHKIASNKAKNANMSTSARRPFLAPSSTFASSSPLPESTRFSTPLSMSSAQAPSKLLTRPQSPSLTNSVASQKPSKIVTEKISALETQVARLEDEQRCLQRS